MIVDNYYDLKTVKLSDSYVVYMHNLQQRNEKNKKIAVSNAWDKNGTLTDEYNSFENGAVDDKLLELYTCTNVDLPSYKYKVESHQIGNNTFKVILPDYSQNPTVTLTLAETNDFMIEKLLKLIIRRNIADGGSYDMQYVDNGWIDVIAVDVLSNDLHNTVMRYQFGFCRLINYDVYDLNYGSDDLPTYRLTFAFESYKKIYNPNMSSLNDIVSDTRNGYDKTINSYNLVNNLVNTQQQGEKTIAKKNEQTSTNADKPKNKPIAKSSVKKPSIAKTSAAANQCKDPATAPQQVNNKDYDYYQIDFDPLSQNQSTPAAPTATPSQPPQHLIKKTHSTSLTQNLLQFFNSSTPAESTEKRKQKFMQYVKNDLNTYPTFTKPPATPPQHLNN